MPHTVTYHSEMHIVEIKAHGNLTLDEAKQIIFDIGKVCVEKNCFHWLGDYREARFELSTIDIYSIPHHLSAILASMGLPANKMKRAVVIANDIEDFEFFETVTVNSGQTTKLFQDMDEAKEWLSKK